jgi:flagellar basal-body rod protein FlgC
MDFDQLFSTFRISASGLAAEQQRMRVIANNLANANVTKAADGAPFRKDVVLFREVLDREARSGEGLAGVRVEGLIKSTEPFRSEYQPGHPDADKTTGMVQLPNVDPVTEMVDMITASRAYQANLAVLTTYKEMMLQTLRLSR